MRNIEVNKQISKSVPVLEGKFVSSFQLNSGTMAVITSYGLYSVYRNQEGTEIQLLAVFGDDCAEA